MVYKRQKKHTKISTHAWKVSRWSNLNTSLVHALCYSHCCNGIRNSSIKLPLRTPLQPWLLDSCIHSPLLPGLTLRHVLFCWTLTQLTVKVLVEDDVSKGVTIYFFNHLTTKTVIWWLLIKSSYYIVPNPFTNLNEYRVGFHANRSQVVHNFISDLAHCQTCWY